MAPFLLNLKVLCSRPTPKSKILILLNFLIELLISVLGIAKGDLRF